jgi:protein-S-isoprenylcysteine O-methyltransferase Ste14
VTGVIRILVVVTGVLWFSAETWRSTHDRADATADDRGSRILVQLAALCGAAAALVVTRLTSAPVLATIGPAVAAAGLVVLWCGVALRLWCFRTLGHYFTFTVRTSETQPVIESGPYRVLRHPSYSATLLVLVGLGTFFANGWGIPVLLAIAFGGIAYRIHVEERALLAATGERYRRFAATRKRIIPFVW